MVILIEARVRELKEVNIALIKRRRAKKSCVRAGQPLIIYDIIDILANGDI